MKMKFLLFILYISMSCAYVTKKVFPKLHPIWRNIDTSFLRVLPLSSSTQSSMISLDQFTLSNNHFVKDVLASQSSHHRVIQGVYVIEDNNNSLQYIGSSHDIINELKVFYDRHGSELIYTARLQYLENLDMIDPYKAELIKQANDEVNILDWGTSKIISMPDEAASHLPKANPKLEALKSIISSMKAQGSLTPSDAIVSPFEDTNSTTSMTTPISSQTELELKEFTFENIDMVLNEVRPYLIADGGNVSVVSIDALQKNIYLQLQGACGGCPSSTTTMKMGIECILKENFPYVNNIIAVTPVPELLTVGMVENALAAVKATIAAMKGEVIVKGVDAVVGLVVIGYRGPTRLKQGLELILKDMKLIKSIIFEDM